MSDAKDLLLIFIGQAAINIADRFWRYAYETLNIPLPNAMKQMADIDKVLHEKLDMTEFYSEYEIEEARRMIFYNLLDERDKNVGKTNKYIPRALFLDLESQPIRYFQEQNKDMFPKEAYIYDTYGSHSMYARAKRLGKNLKPYILERIQSMTRSRAIVNLEGIIIVHATGGGAGSGLLDPLMEVLNDQYSRVPTLSFTILPSPKLSGNVVEAYNTVYALDQLLTKVDASIVLDNEKIVNLIRKKYEINSPTYEDLNLVISRLIFGVIMQFSMPGASMRIDFNKVFTNLVPYKYMKFLCTTISPFKFDEFSQNKLVDMVPELTDPENFLAEMDFNAGKYTSAMFLFMGKVGPEVKTYIRLAKPKMDFMPWIATGTFLALTPRERMTLDGKPLDRQGIMIANHSSIRFVFQRIFLQFKAMFEKQAFMTHFLRENIDSKKELEKAAQSLIRTIKFYQIAEKSG